MENQVAPNNANFSNKKSKRMDKENIIIIEGDIVSDSSEPFAKKSRNRYGNVQRWETVKVGSLKLLFSTQICILYFSRTFPMQWQMREALCPAHSNQAIKTPEQGDLEISVVEIVGRAIVLGIEAMSTLLINVCVLLVQLLTWNPLNWMRT